MTKSLMIPVRPQHAVNILNGKKTLELRKWIPKDYVGWVYVYVTKGKPYLLEVCADEYWNTIYQTYDKPFSDRDLNGKVVARFWFDEFIKLEWLDISLNVKNNLEWLLPKLCLTKQQVIGYGKRRDLYAWHIKKLEIFDEPKSLSDFNLTKPPKRSAWVYGN